MTASPTVCSVFDCGRPLETKGLCNAHYMRFWKTGDVKAHKPIADYNHPRPSCKADKCERLSRSKGFCRMHYGRIKRDSELGGNEPLQAVRGSGTVTLKGYKFFCNKKTGYYYEHRKIMEDFLGRKLFVNENVHHKNGVRSDNRIENLELWNTCQPKGQRIPDKIKWAIELIQQYPEYAAAEGYQLTDKTNNVILLSDYIVGAMSSVA